MSCCCKNNFEGSEKYWHLRRTYTQTSFIMRKLTELLESELLSHSNSRDLELFENFFGMEPEAHFVSDLHYVCSILELFPGKMYGSEICEEYYEKFLKLCGVPPLLLRPSELLTCDEDLKQLFSVLGGLLFYLKKEEQRCILLEALTNLLSFEVANPQYHVSSKKLQHAAAESLLPKIVGRFLSFASDKMYQRFLKISIILVEASNTAGYKMLEEGALDSLLVHLCHSSDMQKNNNQKILTELEIKLCFYEEISLLIWLLLKTLKSFDSEKIRQLPFPSRSAFWSLRSAFKFFHVKKIDRNNIVAILLKIVEVFPTTEFVQSGLAEDIVRLNLMVESNTISSDWPGLQIAPCLKDFIFVRMLLMFLYYFDRPEYYGGIYFLRNTTIIGMKLKYVTQSQTVKWHKDHLGKLMSIMLSVLAQTASYIIEVILAEKGILKFMEILLMKEYNIDVHLSLLRSLIILMRMDQIKSRMIINRLLDIRAKLSLIAYCEAIMCKDSLDFKDQLSVSYCFSILETIFKTKNVIRNENLMVLSIGFLQRIRSPWEQDPFMIPQLPISIISCLWNILLCDEQNLQQFIQSEGIYICLDLAETCVWPVKIVSLGLLTEVCEESSTISFFITWRSKNHQNTLQFLLSIFREENRMLGVQHTTDGLIKDIELILMGLEQYKYLCDPKNTLENSPSISDMIGSCRPKIYAILDILSRVHVAPVRMANEIYKMWNQDLSLKDKLTKVIAENFFALKIFELWDEVLLHFERSSIRPVANDYEMFCLVIKRAKNFSAVIRDTQREINRIHREKEIIRENVFYMDLREARLSQTLGAYCELEYIARCTKDSYRMRLKKKYNLHLMENQTEEKDPNIIYHPTFMYDFMVNPVFDHVLHIANISNIAAEHKETRGPLTPRMKKAMQKYRKPCEEILLIPSDQLWGSLSDEICIHKI